MKLKSIEILKRKSYIKAVALLTAVVLLLAGCQGLQDYVKDVMNPEEENPFVVPETTPAPLLYEEGGEVFMACGAKTISLGLSTQLYDSYDSFNAMLSKDNSLLFFLKCGGTNSGELMKVGSDLSSSPVSMAQGICAAQASNNGESVLYITGIEDITGDLYLKAGGEPELIAHNVVPIYYGFSPDGGCIYYFVQEDSGTLALYIKKGNETPSLVAKHSKKPYLDHGILLDYIADIVPDDEGRLLYSFNNGDWASPLMLYSGGESKIVSSDGCVEKVFGSLDDLLYTEYDNDGYDDWSDIGSLWYKAPGLEPVKIADKASAVFSDGETNQSIYDYMTQPDVWGDENDKRLIVEESPGGNLGEEAILYEQELGGERVEIVKSDAYSFVHYSPQKDCVAYGREGKRYISLKAANGWSEAMLSETSDMMPLLSSFDAAGSHFYYVDSTDYTGEALYRYSIKQGEKEELIKNCSTLFMAGNNVYALTENGDTYRINAEGKAIKIDIKANSAVRTQGGVYLQYYQNEMTGYDEASIADIYFLEDGSDEAQLICRSAAELYAGLSIDYYPPIEKDPAQALDLLIEDAYYYQAALEGEDDGSEPSMPLEKAIELSKSFGSQDDSGDYSDSFAMLYEGFINYSLWEKEAGGDKKELYRLTALLKLREAVDNHYGDEGEGDDCDG